MFELFYPVILAACLLLLSGVVKRLVAKAKAPSTRQLFASDQRHWCPANGRRRSTAAAAAADGTHFHAVSVESNRRSGSGGDGDGDSGAGTSTAVILSPIHLDVDAADDELPKVSGSPRGSVDYFTLAVLKERRPSGDGNNDNSSPLMTSLTLAAATAIAYTYAVASWLSAVALAIFVQHPAAESRCTKPSTAAAELPTVSGSLCWQQQQDATTARQKEDFITASKNCSAIQVV